MNPLTLRLTLVLAPIAIIFGALPFFVCPAEGLWMNLATEVAGVLVTVLIVDRLIAQHRTSEWQGYKSRGLFRCRVLCNAIISTLRHAGRWSPSVITDNGPLDEQAVHERLLAFGKYEIAKSAPKLVAELKTSDWATIRMNFDGAIQEIEAITRRFDRLLAPKQLEAIDEMARKLSAVMFFPTTFPEMFDRDHPREDIRHAGIQHTSRAIVELILSVATLSETLQSEDAP